MSPKNNPEFASLVGRAFRATGLTQDEFARRGGPSDTTLRNIIDGKEVGVSTATLKKLDAAFGWSAGTAAKALMGIPSAIASAETATVHPPTATSTSMAYPPTVSGDSSDDPTPPDILERLATMRSSIQGMRYQVARILSKDGLTREEAAEVDAKLAEAEGNIFDATVLEMQRIVNERRRKFPVDTEAIDRILNSLDTAEGRAVEAIELARYRVDDDPPPPDIQWADAARTEPGHVKAGDRIKHDDEVNQDGPEGGA